MRFASRLEFGEKTHEVSMTAQRLVQRMKKDSIHSGRRPSGLCGAALLLAARMHDFGRTPHDIIRIVKIHESTLRKRLLEFGETPSSVLTIDEFMTVDLEAEQDPPAFKAARKKDKELIQRVAEDDHEFTELQREIEARLDSDLCKRRRLAGSVASSPRRDERDESEFIRESTLETIKGCLEGEPETELEREAVEGIAPDVMAICASAVASDMAAAAEQADQDAEATLDDFEDDEINSYILNEAEARRKEEMWAQLNAEYLEEAKAREERLEREREEGRPERRRKKATRKTKLEPSSTAGEAIEKILQEKKISSKINYDILKSLTDSSVAGPSRDLVAKTEPEPVAEPALAPPSRRKANPNLGAGRARRRPDVGLPLADAEQQPKLERVVETGGEWAMEFPLAGPRTNDFYLQRTRRRRRTRRSQRWRWRRSPRATRRWPRC